MTSPTEIYRHVTSMEPLFPKKMGGELAALSVAIFIKSGELKASLPSLIVRTEVAQLVQEMNSYYSNLIEGHRTLPRDIEKALQDDFAGAEEERRNQQLSVAHIRAEQAMRARLANEPTLDVFGPSFICWLHQEFYSHLPEEHRFTRSLSGKKYSLTPGKFRTYNVDVGRHTPPDHSTLGAFLDRFQSFYSNPEMSAAGRLIALAAAHHRLAWIHPFGDGNGRVARLQSQAAIVALGLDSEGLWTLSRGLARAKSTYFTLLQNGDIKRINDLDGRGNLSDTALAEFCKFFLKRIVDQLDFMVGLIKPFDLKERIENYLRFQRTDLPTKQRGHFERMLTHLCINGTIRRGDVASVLNLGSTAARDAIRAALAEGLVSSESEKGPIRIAFPAKVAEFYFPQLFTDLPVEPAA